MERARLARCSAPVECVCRDENDIVLTGKDLFTLRAAVVAILSLSAVLLLSVVNCVKPTIDITSPAAGEKLLAGDTISVRWTPSISKPVASYNYHLTSSVWQLFDIVIPVNSQEVKVVLPTTWYTDSFQIKVEDGSSASKAGVTPYLPEKYVVLTSPIAGQTVKVGDSVTISWRLYPAQFASPEIRLSLSGGSTDSSFHDIPSGSFPNSVTSFLWVVGSEKQWNFAAGYPSSTCMVQVRDYQANASMDESGIFKVVMP
jgi:hypothetical protein